MKNIKKLLESNELNTWGFKYYDTIKKAKIKKIKDIKYILNKCGNAIQCFNKKIKNNKELALTAVKQNGHAIHYLDQSIQKDIDIINTAIKRGRTDSGYKGVKLKFILPDISYWHLKFNNKKFKKHTIGRVVNLKLNDTFNENQISFYTGETINGVPNGKGISETYESVKGLDEKVHKIKGKEWVKNYQKSFLKKLKYHNIESKYIGEWKNGIENGLGELIVYHGPDYFLNNDGGPKVFSKSIGNFTDGKKNGEFKEYSDLGEVDYPEKTWVKIYYKHGHKIK